MIPVDGDFILEVAPRFRGRLAEEQARIVGAIAGQFAAILDSYEINTELRIAHFMGQVTHECAGFRTTEEFASGAKYEGRADLGNTRPGDGRRYKGRGLLQLTGRTNYRTMGTRLGLDLEGDPKLAADPLTSLKIACEYWKDRRINPKCDADDLVAVTKAVNGGLNGFEDRRDYLRRAKTALKARVGTIVAHEQGGAHTVLRRGSFGAEVARLQLLLRKAGFPLSVDQDFGAATELAVMQFQARKKIAVTGLVDRATWTALEA
jgi:putative chitinase